jgi:hypothetical protein
MVHRVCRGPNNTSAPIHPAEVLRSSQRNAMVASILR